MAFNPTVGVKYRITREITVIKSDKAGSSEGVLCEENRWWPIESFEWEEIEPEYEEGALYLAAGGSLLQRIGDQWAFYSDTFSPSFDIHKHGLNNNWPKRPLRRVFLEGET